MSLFREKEKQGVKHILLLFVLCIYIFLIFFKGKILRDKGTSKDLTILLETSLSYG